ncbi:MAG: ATP-dependent DNA helicase RecG [Candidatus Margulisiibacteriota bacterium]
MTNVKLETPVQYLKGVGPKIAKLLRRLGVETIQDLIYFFPRDYEDRTKIKSIGALNPSDFEVIRGEVIRVDHQLTRNRFSILKAVISDRSGSIQAVWFNQPYLVKLLRRGMKLFVTGKVEFSSFESVLQISVRDFEIDTGVNPKIVPIYPLTEGIYPKKLRSIVETALRNHLSEIEEWLPENVRDKYKLCDLSESIDNLHFPEKLSRVEPSRRRLAFDDFFVFQLGLGLRRKSLKAKEGIVFDLDHEALNDFRGSLPFKLTSAQERVLTEILFDMQNPHPMNRLLQGDVGSGKTVIAAMAALIAIQNGYQVAIMAPTEILAQQHYAKLVKMFKGLNVKAELLTASTSKKTVESGRRTVDLVIGTHALIQEKVGFEKLGLVIIDEQHRFGVLQRANLVKKAITPDVLVMTATPIPRSLALTLYGEFDRSVIDEMPPGRTPVKTFFVSENKRSGAYEFMRERIKEGRQIFVVCPLVEESEKVDLKAAMDEAGRLQKDIFPEYSVGLMHGRLKGEEKGRIMRDFKSEKIHILVSTTVIEVGIDIPNATIMVIEHAERFGLSQLHQLRGRIGRGAEQSYCFLVAEAKTGEARTRIKAMLDSSDGFHIAEVDLRLRGPGDFYGTRQSGLPIFRVADIIRDEKILREARTAAFELIAEDLNYARYIWKSQGKKAKSTETFATLN